eukprot:FR741254.1.p1 GENE.FR741254.1~~FR741254.1.p1  ORF type:complete len:164 (+),score=23.10 FR741254.1:66-494(+)
MEPTGGWEKAEAAECFKPTWQSTLDLVGSTVEPGTATPATLTASGVGSSLKFNIYLYDAGHSRQDHYDALVTILPYLADTFVLLVDDFNHTPVIEGTFEAIKTLGLELLHGEVLGGNRENTHLGPWHNGFYVAVVRKPLSSG